MLTTKQKGNLTELLCVTAFYRLGFNVSIPYGENCRYDFIADISGNLIRVQCKTSRPDGDGSIKFSCRSVRINSTGNIERWYTREEIDFFCTYYDNECYLIPVEECAGAKTIRISEAKNNQKKGISYAKDYLLETQIERMVNS